MRPVMLDVVDLGANRIARAAERRGQSVRQAR